MEDIESDSIMEGRPHKRKRLLILRFLKGPLLQGQPREIPLTGERSLLFGCKDAASKFVLNGERVVESHMEISFDHNTLVLKNLNLNPWESCGVYRRLFDDESYNLRPGHAFRIGQLEFVMERYNTGIVSDIGQRPHMEDSYQVVQDLYIDEDLLVTYYAVFDGHGGAECA